MPWGLPYQEFEDQRSGETLGILQKVRIDTEKFVASFVNVLFPVIIGILFVAIFAYRIHPFTSTYLLWRHFFTNHHFKPA